MNENKKINVKRLYRLTTLKRAVIVREEKTKSNEPFKRFDVTVRWSAKCRAL